MNRRRFQFDEENLPGIVGWVVLLIGLVLGGTVTGR